MRTLPIAAVLSFHYASHAEDSYFVVTMSLEKKEFSDDINGGYTPLEL